MPRPYLPLVGAVGVALLTGCISRQDMALRHRSTCATYGLTPGTEAYSNCLLQLDAGDYGYSHHGRRWGSHP